MNDIVFIDIESANRQNRIAKIYEITFLFVNKDLSLISNETLIFDPEAKFYFNTEDGYRRIKPPHKLEVMKKNGNFVDNYKKIREYLEGNIIFGYGTSSDAYMLIESCKRYGLEMISFDFYDIKDFIDKFEDRSLNGLTNCATHFGIVNDAVHTSYGDVITTLELTKKVFEKHNIRYDYLQSYEYKDYLYTVNKNNVYRKNDLKHIKCWTFKDMKLTKEEIDEVDSKGIFDFFPL